jgi:tRNA threonylcarbamoyladenosine biosynthesis protein TsaB
MELRGEIRLHCEGSHSRRLLPAVCFLLEALGLEPAAIDAYAPAVGPGSFTGLRIGISTVQGLALATGRPCLGVSALDALAWRIRGASEALVVMMDAQRGEVYGALYDRQGGPQGPPTAEPPESFLRRAGARAAAYIGDGAQRYRAQVLEADPHASFPERSLFLAGAVAALAAQRLAAGEGVSAAALRPLYLRPADALRARP